MSRSALLSTLSVMHVGLHMVARLLACLLACLINSDTNLDPIARYIISLVYVSYVFKLSAKLTFVYGSICFLSCFYTWNHVSVYYCIVLYIIVGP